MASLHALAVEVLEARADYEVKRKAKTKAEEKKKELEAKLNTRMQREKIPTTTLDLGEPWGKQQLGTRSKTFARVIDKEALARALEEEGLSEGYTKIDFQKGALNDLLRDRIRNGEPLPDGLDWSDTKYVQFTKR